MDDHPELTTAMLALAFSAVLLLAGHFYIEQRATGDLHRSVTSQQLAEDLNVRGVSETSPHMRSAR